MKFEQLYNNIVPLFALCDELPVLVLELGRTCAQLLNAESVRVFIVDSSRDLLYGYTGDAKQEQTFPLRDSENVACHVAVSGQTINLTDCKSQKRFRVQFQEDMVAENALILPIKNQRTLAVFGVFVAINKQGRSFNEADEAICEDLQRICYTAMALAVERYSHMKAIEALIDQRNNLSNAKDLENTKTRTEKLCRLLALVSKCVDPLTAIHRFVQGAKEALGVQDIKYVPYSQDNGGMLLAESAVESNVGALGRCVQTQRTVHVPDPLYNRMIHKESDLPANVNHGTIAEMLYVPFFSSPERGQKKDGRNNTGRGEQIGVQVDGLQLQGIWRVSASESGTFDKHFQAMVEAVSELLQYLCDRGAKLEQTAIQSGFGGATSTSISHNSSNFQEIYGANGMRNLFKAVVPGLRKSLRCSRAYILVADETNDVLWTVLPPNYDTKVEVPLNNKHIEGQVYATGTVVNVINLNKPCLDQVLGYQPNALIAVPIRDSQDKKVKGVLVGVDKKGMAQFDQVDEIQAIQYSSATAIGLKHALLQLKKAHECRQYHLFSQALVTILKCNNFREFVVTSETLLCSLSTCKNCDLFLLTREGDAVVKFRAKNQPSEDDDFGSGDDGNDKEDPKSETINAGYVAEERIPLGRVDYVDKALVGQVVWPDGIFLREDGEEALRKDERNTRIVCIVPICMASGAIIGMIRLHDDPVRQTFEDLDIAMLQTFGCVAGEVANWLRKTYEPARSRDRHLQRLILVTRTDGRLVRFNGSTKAVLGKSDSVLRSVACWEWMMENDVWTATMKQLFFGSGEEPKAKALEPAEPKATLSGIYIKDFHWVLKGKVLTAELSCIPYYADSCAVLSQCHICLSNIRPFDGSVVLPLYLTPSDQDTEDHDPSDRTCDSFLLGCHLQLLRDDATDQEFALTSVRMKLIECIQRFDGKIYLLGEDDLYAIFSDHVDCLCAGVAVDQDLGPLIDDFGYDVTVCSTHARFDGAVPVAPPYELSRLRQTSRAADLQDRSRHAVKKTYQAEAPKGDKPKPALGHLSELPDALAPIEVPAPVHKALNDLMQRVLRYDFRGFFICTLPSRFPHDFATSPVERNFSPTFRPGQKPVSVMKALVGRDAPVALARDQEGQEKWLQTICIVHGRMREIPQATLDHMARLQMAFRSMLDGKALLQAIQELVGLIQSGLHDRLSLMVTPQLILLLRRAMRLLLDQELHAQWQQVWDWEEPSTEMLRQLVKPFSDNFDEEPWLRQFLDNAVDMLGNIEAGQYDSVSGS